MTLVWRTLTLAVLAVTVALWAAQRVQLSYDLSYFLPAPNTDAQRVLVERLGQGPGSQLIFIVLPDTSRSAAESLANNLRQYSEFSRVLPETLNINVDQIPAPIWHRRLLLTELPATQQAWHDVLLERLDDLMFADDDASRMLIAADPTLGSLNALATFANQTGPSTYAYNGAQFLIVETRGAAFDLDAQAAAVALLREVLLPFDNAQLLGSGVYGVDLQASVQFEATLFSILASIALLLLMIWRFRSIVDVIGVALPLLMGGSAGLLILTLIFKDIHGITLAFGFTLLGVAIDYPLHLYTHARSGVSTLQQGVWPTLRLGIASTLIAYGAFVFSGTAGLQQLGVFAATGTIAAALAAAWLGTAMPHRPAIVPSRNPQPRLQQLGHKPWMLTLLATLPLLVWLPIFEDDLSSLTPVDKKLLQADAQLRKQMGVADIRHLIAVRGDSLEQSLIDTELAVAKLSNPVSTGALSSLQSVTQLLPSRATQQARRLRLQQPAAIERFEQALADLPFADDAFTPFTDRWHIEADEQDYLTLQTFTEHEAISGLLNSLLFKTESDWISLIYLIGIEDLPAVEAAVADLSSAQLIDLKQASTSMVAEYRRSLFGVLGVALGLIAVILFVGRSLEQLAWLLGSVAAAVSVAALASTLLQSGLSLFDLMALTLVAGLGMDYALFFSRTRAIEDDLATRQAVLLCAASSFLVFGILSFSGIPVLKGIGTTVALGVAAAYLLARFGRQENSGA